LALSGCSDSSSLFLSTFTVSTRGRVGSCNSRNIVRDIGRMISGCNSEYIQVSVADKPTNISNIEPGREFERRMEELARSVLSCFGFFGAVGFLSTIFLAPTPPRATWAEKSRRSPVICWNRDQNERKASSSRDARIGSAEKDGLECGRRLCERNRWWEVNGSLLGDERHSR
jgi:hypothetical protein